MVDVASVAGSIDVLNLARGNRRTTDTKVSLTFAESVAQPVPGAAPTLRGYARNAVRTHRPELWAQANRADGGVDVDVSAETRIDVPIEGSTAARAALLESTLRAEELRRRPSRPTDDIKFPMSKREEAEAEVRELARGLEAKIRRRMEANVVGIVVWSLEPLHKHGKSERPHLDGVITGANDAFLRMVQYDREELAFGRLRWTDLTPDEWRGHDEQAVADLKATGIFQPFEKEYFRKDGTRVPVLLGGALFGPTGNNGVAFVLDLSDPE